MLQSTSLENDALRIESWPGYGGKITSVIDKADGFNLLFSYQRELPGHADYDIAYDKGWYAGWDECFPGIGRAPYAGPPYHGISVPDHGELWGLPAAVAVDGHCMLTRWHGVRFAYQLTRRLRLSGSTLEASYELENFSPFVFRFVWAMHSLMSMTAPVRLAYHGTAPWLWTHDGHGQCHNRRFAWPDITPSCALTSLCDLPTGEGWKMYCCEPIDRPFTLIYPTRGRRLRISYHSDSHIDAYWGVWINTGAWAGHTHFAIEPTTGRRDRLDEAIEDQAAASVGPLGKVRWGVQWTLDHAS